MSVFRINKSKDYTIMSNGHFREKEMSLKAKGLLSLMLSLPDEWDYSINGLVSICKENESAIKSTLNELKAFGYLEVIKKLPNTTDTGRIEYIYNVYEKAKQEGKKQGVENLPLEIQPVEIQSVENHTQLNTNILNTKESNTKELNTKRECSTTTKKFVKPTVEDIQNYCNEKGYKIDAEYFIDYYDSKGWLIGKTPMKDWKAAIRNWARRDNKNENKKEEVKQSWWEDMEQDPDSVWNL